MPLNSARSLAKLRIAEALSSWVRSTVLLSRISAVVTSKFSLAVWMKEFEVSMIWPRSSPVPSNASPNSVTTVCSASLSTEATVFEMSSSSWPWGAGSGCSRPGSRILAEGGPVVGLRLELDVLLTDRGAVADDRERVRRDVVPLVVDVEQDVHAVVGDLEVADVADGDAAVGHLGAVEDAAGLSEVRSHGVVVVEEDPVETGVLGADVGAPEQRDQHEDEQLDLGATRDHRATPGRSRATRIGS